MPKAEVKDDHDKIRAMHQWMASQEIDRKEWGYLFARAAAYEIFHVSRGEMMLRLSGIGILCNVISNCSNKDLIS